MRLPDQPAKAARGIQGTMKLCKIRALAGLPRISSFVGCPSAAGTSQWFRADRTFPKVIIKPVNQQLAASDGNPLKSGRGEESMDAIWTCRLAIVAAIVGQSAYSQAQDAPTDPVRVLVGRLDLDTYKATIKGLTQFGDRREGTARNRAAVDWIEAQLRNSGCTNTERVKIPVHHEICGCGHEARLLVSRRQREIRYGLPRVCRPPHEQY